MVAVGVRIIAGTWGGRILRTPEGTRTRPSADRVREALFSSLAARFPELFDGCTVLDAFAGSGALGLEAMSRGCGRGVFVDASRSALAAVNANVDSLGPDDVAVVQGDVFRLARRGGLGSAPFSLILLDPPYRIEESQVRALLQDLREGGLIASRAVVAYEHATGSVIDWPAFLEGVVEHAYGDTQVSIAVARGE